MIENLRDPLFLFFLVGLTGGLLKSDLKLPDAIYQLLSTYLLLAIGLKGGVQLSSPIRRRSRGRPSPRSGSGRAWPWGYSS